MFKVIVQNIGDDKVLQFCNITKKRKQVLKELSLPKELDNEIAIKCIIDKFKEPYALYDTRVAHDFNDFC